MNVEQRGKDTSILTGLTLVDVSRLASWLDAEQIPYKTLDDHATAYLSGPSIHLYNLRIMVRTSDLDRIKEFMAEL